MAANFTVAWTPGASIDDQTVKYRQRGYSAWITNANIDPPNNIADSVDTVDVTNLNVNTVYQFQVDSNKAGTIPASSSMFESIKYDEPEYTTSDATTIIGITMPAMPTVDTVYFYLWGDVGGGVVLIDSGTTTGVSPSITFTGLDPGTYEIRFYMETLVNGVTLASTDPSEMNAMIVTDPIVI